MVEQMDYQDYEKALEFDQRLSGMTWLQSQTQSFIDELDIQESDKVLDVGTGTGRLGLTLRDMVPKGFIVGIDSGYGMLKVARDKILKCQAENFLLVRGKAEALPFLPGVFDSACLMSSLHHFTEPGRALGEIYQTLKTNGRLVSLDTVLEEVVDEEDRKLNETIIEIFQLSHGPGFNFLTVSELRRLYESAGFLIDSCSVHVRPFRQIGTVGLPMGGHWLQIEEALRFRRQRDLHKKLAQNYLSLRKEGDQMLVEGKTKWVTIKATKN